MQLPPVFENEEEVTRLPDAGVTRLWKISGLYLEDVVTCDELDAFCTAVPLRPRFEETAVAEGVGGKVILQEGAGRGDSGLQASGGMI